MKKSVAFICVHNSCRSQMAEGFAKNLLSQQFDVYSAGTENYKEVKPGAVAVMEEIGINMEEHYPKLLSDIPPKIDVVVTMGCNVDCPYLPCDFREDWGLDDPSGGPLDDFRATRELIKSKVIELGQRLESGEFDA